MSTNSKVKKIGRIPGKDKPVLLNSWERETLLKHLIDHFTGMTWPPSRLLRPLEPFRFQVVASPPNRYMSKDQFPDGLYPRTLDRAEFKQFAEFLSADDPYSDMARNLCYLLVKELKQYRDRTTTAPVCIPTNWESEAPVEYWRSRGLTFEQTAEALETPDREGYPSPKTASRWERRIVKFYRDLSQ